MSEKTTEMNNKIWTATPPYPAVVAVALDGNDPDGNRPVAALITHESDVDSANDDDDGPGVATLIASSGPVRLETAMRQSGAIQTWR